MDEFDKLFAKMIRDFEKQFSSMGSIWKDDFFTDKPNKSHNIAMEQFENMFSPLFLSKDDNFFNVFTQKRMELLKQIKTVQPNSIRELAETLNRDIKNVWGDLCVLQKNNIIEFETKGRSKIPVLRRRTIILEL